MLFHKRALNPSKGFTLVEIMIVVAIIGILVIIALPGWMRARSQSQAKACLENQFKTEGATMRYALEFETDEVPDLDILIGVVEFIQSTPTCPTTGQPTKITGMGYAECPTNEDGHDER